jgi:hypothetical protein
VRALETFGFGEDVRGLGTRLVNCVDHRLRVRWLSHPFGQFLYAIAKVRTIETKLLGQRDHLGDFLLAKIANSRLRGSRRSVRRSSPLCVVRIRTTK